MNKIKKIGILGAGMMGSDIALCCALSGYEVLLKDVSLEVARASVAKLQGSLAKWVQKGRIKADAVEQESALARILPTDNWSGFDQVDLVIEAVFEDLQIKADNYTQLEAVCKVSCIVATNTSSIPVTRLGATWKSLERKARFLGLHFFSPASVMKLVEVIKGEETSDDTMVQACEFCVSIAKDPVKVADCAGFVANRILGAINDEAMRLFEEGVATPEDIDKACRLGLGHPIGPFALMDQVGTDLNLKIGRIFHEIYGERFHPRPVLVKKVDAGHLGRKTGKGWYDYGTC